MEFSKWVACWGTGTSITNQKEARFAKDLTLRYPVFMCFSGTALRFRFSNFTGKEPVKLTASAAKTISGSTIDAATSKRITVGGETEFTILPGMEVESDPLPFEVRTGEVLSVSIYLPDYTDMNSGVLVTGPRSKGWYAYGDFAGAETLPADLTRNTNWYYFLNTVDVFTEEKNHAVVCYGDSITAQSWPDYLAIRAYGEGKRNVSIIRRAVSGTRILRQYDCITYAAYGLKGETRFPLEINTAGADTVILQHGINDIIHPVGIEENRFRPMSDLPTAEEMEEGFTKLYIEEARRRGMKVYGGTLLPILKWRTYEPFRETLRKEFNEWLKSSELFDGCIDFDAAVRDKAEPRDFGPGFDSGDHLHPSEAAYKAMAYAVPEELLK